MNNRNDRSRCGANRWALPACIAIFLCSSAAVHAAAKPEIWRGSSAGYSVTWTASDILVSQSGKSVLSLRAAALRDWHQLAEQAGATEISGQTSFRVLSLAGPILSVEEVRYCECGGAHPSEVRRFVAIDLRASSPDKAAPALLSSWFSEGQIFDALRSDPLVQSALKDNEAPMPASLSGLLDVLNYKTAKVGECQYLFKKEMLESFAFFSADADQLKVRLSLPHAEEVCRGQLTEIGLQLTGTPKLTAEVSLAERRHDLMNELQKLSPDRKMVVVFAH